MKKDILLWLLISVLPLKTSIIWSSEGNYHFNYQITATGTEDISVYPDQLFNWHITGIGTETWLTYPNQSFVWTVKGTAIETWRKDMPNQEDPTANGFYNLDGAWYKDGKRVTQSSVSEFRVIEGKPFWKYNSEYYYNSMTNSSNTQWNDSGKCTLPNATCFFVFKGGVYYKVGDKYYYNDLSRYNIATRKWCENGYCSDPEVSNFIITDIGVFYSLPNQYYYNDLSGYNISLGQWGNSGVCTHTDVSQFRFLNKTIYWSYKNSDFRNSLSRYTSSLSKWGDITLAGHLPPSETFYEPCDYDVKSSVVTSTALGSSAVNAQEGKKLITSFNAEPQPLHGGEISDISYSIMSSNPDVLVTITENNIFASTNVTETHSAVRTAKYENSGSVNKTEGDKYMDDFNAYPEPIQGGKIEDLMYFITDNSKTTETWIANNKIYANTRYSETVTRPWAKQEEGSGSIRKDNDKKYIFTSTLNAPNHDTTWTVIDDSNSVETLMIDRQLFALVADPNN